MNGNNRQNLFLADHDRNLYLLIFRETAEKYGWDVKAYCMMDTHWHAVLRTPDANLSAGMQRLNTGYSRSFNKLNGRTGHSIRHRYMSVLVEDDQHAKELTRYLPLNPVRGGLVSHPEDWRWSSHRAALRLTKRPGWFDVDWPLRYHDSVRAYRAYVRAGMAEPGAQEWTPGSDPFATRPRRPEGCTAPPRPASA